MKSKDYTIIDIETTSRPTRGAWIEIAGRALTCRITMSRPTRGAWIEMHNRRENIRGGASRPTRGAWIEMSFQQEPDSVLFVAPHTGRVD